MKKSSLKTKPIKKNFEGDTWYRDYRLKGNLLNLF